MTRYEIHLDADIDNGWKSYTCADVTQPVIIYAVWTECLMLMHYTEFPWPKLEFKVHRHRDMINQVHTIFTITYLKNVFRFIPVMLAMTDYNIYSQHIILVSSSSLCAVMRDLVDMTSNRST